MLGRLRRPADFESVLATPAKARSAHFSAHHLASQPQPQRGAGAGALAAKLSTEHPDRCPQPVDDQPAVGPASCWFGLVVPKRHARRAATRNLLRRQMRGAMARHHPRLAHGMWLLRLRVPFDPKHFKSAAPSALRDAARAELDGLLMRATA